MTTGKLFSFAEIVQGRDASVRVTGDNMIYAVDLAMVMTGLARDQAGLSLRRLSEEKILSIKMIEKNTGGSGNSKTKLVSFQDAIELIMVLPGKVAKETRTKFADIIKRYLAGDSSLISEIETNAQSAAPIAQMARAALSAEAPAQNELSLPHKRKLEELEISKLEIEITKQQVEIAKMKEEVEAKRLANIKLERDSAHEHIAKCTSSYRALCEDTVMDERARLVFKDNFLNMAMLQGPSQPAASSQALLTNGQAVPPSNNKPTSLSLVASEMGLRIPTNDLISIGGKLKKRYVDMHGKEPSKHDQLCSGRMTKVNSYTEADRPLIEAVLREWPRA